jgi:hypothetical protein
MKDLCGDYRDERRQEAGRWAALVGAIRYWVDDRSNARDRSEPRPKQASAPVVDRVAEQVSR